MNNYPIDFGLKVKRIAIGIILLAIVIGAILLLTGCADKKKPHITSSAGRVINYETITIDGCEYLLFRPNIHMKNYMIVHKGNCSNPMHLYQLEKAIQNSQNRE